MKANEAKVKNGWLGDSYRAVDNLANFCGTKNVQNRLLSK